MNRKLIVLAGPTAVGKSALAITLAREMNTVILSADSRQMYREMQIGTARPGPGEQNGIPHYFTGNLSVHDTYTAGMFENDALELLGELFPRHPAVILCGGSGLYINALCYGIDNLPRVNPALRDELRNKYREEGLNSIREMLKELDPVYYGRADLNNPKRILKGLEISIMTGKPYSAFLTGHRKERPFGMLLLGLDRPRDELYTRINTRVERMVEQGLVEEARKLYPLRHLNALQTVGYRELFSHFDGNFSLEHAIEKIKDHTRKYARKQLTWFRKNREINWFHPDDLQAIRKLINRAV